MKKFLNLLLTTGCSIFLFSGCLQPKKQEAPITPEDSQEVALLVEEESISPSTKTARHSAGATVRTATTLAGIQEIISNNPNVVVDFFATWCGPCMYMSPIIDQLAQERTDIVFVKVDTDQFADAFKGFELAGKQMRISGIPSIHLFKNGKSIEDIRGSTDKASFTKILETHFGK